MLLLCIACQPALTTYLSPGASYQNNGDEDSYIVLIKKLPPQDRFQNCLKDTVRVLADRRLLYLYLQEQLHEKEWEWAESKLKVLDAAIEKQEAALQKLKKP